MRWTLLVPHITGQNWSTKSFRKLLKTASAKPGFKGRKLGSRSHTLSHYSWIDSKWKRNGRCVDFDGGGLFQWRKLPEWRYGGGNKKGLVPITGNRERSSKDRRPGFPKSFTISQSLLKLMSIELVMLSNHLSLCIILSISQNDTGPREALFPTKKIPLFHIIIQSRLFSQSTASSFISQE